MDKSSKLLRTHKNNRNVNILTKQIFEFYENQSETKTVIDIELIQAVIDLRNQRTSDAAGITKSDVYTYNTFLFKGLE